MNLNKNGPPESRKIECPYCYGVITVSIRCVSMPCHLCNQHINVKDILFPPDKKRKAIIKSRTVSCFKCGKKISADMSAQAVTCKYCYNRNDMSDHKLKSILGKNFETYGSLYLKKKGIIEISNVRVGSAIIKGKVKGDLYSMGTVEILKHGEIYGKITCRKLVVKKGGIFSGKVQMLDA